MRIVITSNYKVGNETGTAYVAEVLSKYLSKKHEVTYICFGKKFKVSKKIKNLIILTIPSIDISGFSFPLITPNVIFKTFKFLNEFEPNIVHSQNTLFISNLVQIWANLNNIPFFVTFHHIPTQAVEHLLPKFKKSLFSNLVQDLYKELSLKSFLKNTDQVIALNKLVENSIRRVNSTIPVQIIGNGLDLSKLLSIKIKTDMSKNIKFIFLGSYNERKNQEFLIKTFRNLPNNWNLNLYGNLSTNVAYVEKLKSLIKKFKLKNIFLNEYEKDVTRVFKNADFFISSSLKEAQSLAIIQSLAAARPVIGLENETVLELINDKNGLRCGSDINSKQFAKKIIDFVKKCNYKFISKESRKSALQFKIEDVVLKIENLYEIRAKAYKSTSYSNSQNSRRNVGKYYQEIFKRIVVKK